MSEVLALPNDPIARATLRLVQSTVSEAIVEHSVRSFLFARLIAEQEGSVHDAEYDEGLLFAATTLHDLALGTLSDSSARFEVEGADLASRFLREQGIADDDASRVWEAIALHSSVGLADRMGLLTSLTHRGVFTDGGRVSALPEHLAEPVRRAYPRPPGDSSLREAIIAHGRRSAAAVPPFSIAADLIRRLDDPNA
ncbi:HD domain-containing protein [Agromyces sp. Soil535]|uniref:HD domain-containing protein n=1 Tax=Agromyces sp. Soil535 TaxID=1736390 RepID=UPI0006FA1BCB|nr:HD domain-containing protein [Agromyces sp. Soil535]KRE24995.1 hypothetical protein ASG80_22165 [Agromyces sp. Soil535]